MLKCYIDDSGSHPQSCGVFVLAGYVMEESRWEDFTDQWDAALKKAPAIRYFHMTDAESGEGEFRGFDSSFRKMKIRDLANVVRKCYPPAIVIRMKWADYMDIVKGKVVDPRLDNPYAFLFFKVLGINVHLQKQFNQLAQLAGFGFTPVDFIFDEQGPVGLKCLDWYEHLKQRVSDTDRSIIGNTPQFKNDRTVNPLQAADMFAWHVRREFAFPNEDRAEIFGMLNPAGAWEYTYTREELSEIVETWNTRLDMNTI